MSKTILFDSFTNLKTRELIYAHIIDRDKSRCAYCNHWLDKEKITIDHLIPRAVGGMFTPSNLTIACYPCNQKKDRQKFFRFIDSLQFKPKKYAFYQEAYYVSTKTHPLYKLHREARFCSKLVPKEMLGNYAKHFPIYHNSYDFDLSKEYSGEELQKLLEPKILKLERSIYHLYAEKEPTPAPIKQKKVISVIAQAKAPKPKIFSKEDIVCLFCGTKHPKLMTLFQNAFTGYEELSIIGACEVCEKGIATEEIMPTGVTFQLELFKTFGKIQETLVRAAQYIDESLLKFTVPDVYFALQKKSGSKEKRKLIMKAVQENLEMYKRIKKQHDR